MSEMSEALIAIPSEEQRSLPPQFPEVVREFFDASRSSGAFIVSLTEKQLLLLDSSSAPHPFDSFNRRFMRDYPVVFTHNPRNRIVLSYLSPQVPIDFSDSLEFVVQPTAIARDSAHGVFFGSLRAAHSDQFSGIEVAVKPYSGETTSRAYSRAWREFISSHIVLHRGIPTIKPLALVFDDKNAYILSRREKLTALADIVWEPFRRELGTLHTLPDIEQFIQTKYRHLIKTDPGSGFASHDQQLSQYFTTLRKLALCLGQLHLKGIFSQDSQIKNFVSETLTNQVWAIDWENTSIAFMNAEATTQDRQKEHEGKNAYYGITQLLLSLIVKRAQQENEHGVTGIGLFDLYFSNVLKSLQAQKPEIIYEMKKFSSQLQKKGSNQHYSEGLLAVTDKISKDILFLFEALFLQHYKTYINSHHPNPKQILEDEPGFKLKMIYHITNILVRDIGYYLSL